MNQKKEEKRTMQKAKQMSNTDPYQNARAREAKQMSNTELYQNARARKAKQMSNTDPYQNARARKGLAVPTSYKKPTVLLIVK